MKNFLRISILVLLCFGLTQCISNIRISVMKPAPVDLANDVEKVLVINNTMLYKEDKADLIEGVLTGEQIKGDRIAAEECSRGVVQSLIRSNAYLSVSIKKIPFKDEETFAIDWDFLRAVCDSHDAQVVMVLDYFDSNAPLGGVLAANALGASGSSLHGEAYFSIYYPREELMKERIYVDDVYHVPSSGHADPLSVASDLMVKRQYLQDLGYNLGYKAGSMLYPNWVWVNREFYGSGHDELKKAKHMIKAGHWDMAEETLKPLLDHKKEKVRKKATFNLALVYEGQGRLDKAMEMAKRSAKEFDDKHAYDYINALEARKADLRQIELQEKY